MSDVTFLFTIYIYTGCSTHPVTEIWKNFFLIQTPNTILRSIIDRCIYVIQTFNNLFLLVLPKTISCCNLWIIWGFDTNVGVIFSKLNTNHIVIFKRILLTFVIATVISHLRKDKYSRQIYLLTVHLSCYCYR